ncbi:hypothetical protein GCM10028820_16980 [Tessaracoccus terricola]
MMKKSAHYEEAEAALDAVGTALEAAITKDRGEADRWWGAEFWDWLTNSEYQQQKQDFENQVNTLVSRARDALTQSRAVLTGRFGIHRDVPSQLRNDAKQWRERANDVATIRGDIEPIMTIEGWEGTAADDYARAAEVQHAAVDELHGVMVSAGNGAAKGAVLNLALFAIAHNAIKELHGLADMDLPGGNGYFYLRTARWGDYLVQLPDVLRRIARLENVQEALAELRDQLGEAITMAQLLEAGQWPTGIDAAGTEPANTSSAVSGNPYNDTNFDVPDSNTPGVCTSGAHRG